MTDLRTVTVGLSPTLMSSPLSGPERLELVSVAHVTALEQQLAAMTVERDRLTHERDEYKTRAEWLHKQLERLKYENKTPRERVDPRQLQLVFEPFAQALLGSAAPGVESEPTSEPSSPDGGDKGRKNKRKTTPHGRRHLPEHLPVETLVLTPSPLPRDARQIDTEVSWRLGYRRACYYRLRIVRPLFVVSKEAADMSTEVAATLAVEAEPSGGNGEAQPSVSAPSHDATHGTPQERGSTGRDADGPHTKTIVVAPAPDEIIPRGLPTPDLLAHILVGKFADKLPFYRQEGISARDGVPITRGTMCGWAKKAHELAHLVVDAMVADSREHAHVIATDATGVLVQANKKCKRGHFWVYVADRAHVVFRYSPTHSSDEPKTFFKGFHGTVLSDASNVYDILFGLPDSPGEANCW